METVYVVTCPDYTQVEAKIEVLFELMGGFGPFVKPGETIILKPNLLAMDAPEKASITHPTIVTAVGRRVKAAGATARIIDSPGSAYPHTAQVLKRLYKACGMFAAAEQAGIEACLDASYEEVSFPEGKLTKRFEVLKPIIDADGVINLCKLKTHGFLSMTGAVKNSFGIIPGRAKPGFHAKFPDQAHFAAMCLDLSNYVAPRLSVMDAVIGMEGNGPNNGSPRPIGLLLAATNPLALDIVASEIIGLDRQDNPLLLEAERQGIRPHRLEQVQVVGANLNEVCLPDFKLPPTVLGKAGSSALSVVGPLLKPILTVQPQIVAAKCVGCGMCRDACPVHAITLERVARIHHRQCIRCYCCHEMCPQDAIELKQSRLYRLLKR